MLKVFKKLNISPNTEDKYKLAYERARDAKDYETLATEGVGPYAALAALPVLENIRDSASDILIAKYIEQSIKKDQLIGIFIKSKFYLENIEIGLEKNMYKANETTPFWDAYKKVKSEFQKLSKLDEYANAYTVLQSMINTEFSIIKESSDVRLMLHSVTTIKTPDQLLDTIEEQILKKEKDALDKLVAHNRTEKVKKLIGRP